ncbi:hypothetical protein [Spiroplasma sp. hyd1]|uniref:hypothetical protein n=1 Tax=Spiroplasma sp. hyd1 TaxID=1609976 RepID=UPI001E5EB364|nr:hypothetical protein [Spiroplasma sp. hyd1]
MCSNCHTDSPFKFNAACIETNQLIQFNFCYFFTTLLSTIVKCLPKALTISAFFPFGNPNRFPKGSNSSTFNFVNVFSKSLSTTLIVFKSKLEVELSAVPFSTFAFGTGCSGATATEATFSVFIFGAGCSEPGATVATYSTFAFGTDCSGAAATEATFSPVRSGPTDALVVDPSER